MGKIRDFCCDINCFMAIQLKQLYNHYNIIIIIVVIITISFISIIIILNILLCFLYIFSFSFFYSLNIYTLFLSFKWHGSLSHNNDTTNTLYLWPVFSQSTHKHIYVNMYIPTYFCLHTTSIWMDGWMLLLPTNWNF